MKQITLRGIPENVKKKAKQEAERKGLSLNKAYILLLDQAVSNKTQEMKKKALHYDLDHFSGLWSREDSATFDKNIKAQRKVDEELWKKTK